ncbi:hypothetical protein C7C46_18975 [Streptomyces tateyamensis]|uniref:Uncharacterized protein n=1 Tax=Streptomyces tateyamensis TaxID=565073 RepID=A0A2V4NDS8_9ACTN|nr:hypothetical protein [Streptomyces tateyamensis]PYC77330.1 hypothetical protein C7C46_18975 [Streptomyces tateyamensis]
MSAPERDAYMPAHRQCEPAREPSEEQAEPEADGPELEPAESETMRLLRERTRELNEMRRSNRLRGSVFTGPPTRWNWVPGSS